MFTYNGNENGLCRVMSKTNLRWQVRRGGLWSLSWSSVSWSSVRWSSVSWSALFHRIPSTQTRWTWSLPSGRAWPWLQVTVHSLNAHEELIMTGKARHVTLVNYVLFITFCHLFCFKYWITQSWYQKYESGPLYDRFRILTIQNCADNAVQVTYLNIEDTIHNKTQRQTELKFVPWRRRWHN